MTRKESIVIKCLHYKSSISNRSKCSESVVIIKIVLARLEITAKISTIQNMNALCFWFSPPSPGTMYVLNLDQNLFQNLLNLAVRNTFFLFNGTFYEQIEGLGMGLL